MEGGNRVCALPHALGAQIASAAYIQSLEHVIEEVVANSIDAGAATITVRCNWETQSFSVEDNGSGIPQEDFSKIGLVHCTSKSASQPTLGFRGAALYALARVARLHIESKTVSEDCLYWKEILDGSVVDQGAKTRGSHGTRVRVWGLWDRYPVRQRVALETRSSKALINLRERLMKLLLPFPWIQCSLYSSPHGALLMQLQKDRSRECSLECIFEKLVESMVSVEVCWTETRLHGWVGMPLMTNVNPRLQWLYINRRSVVSDVVSSCVTEMWSIAGRLLSSSWKLQLMRPAYLLNLELDPTTFDISSEPEKTRVIFKDNENIIAVVKRGLLTAWRGSFSEEEWAKLKARMLPEMHCSAEFQREPEAAQEIAPAGEKEVPESQLGRKRKRGSIWMPVLRSEPRALYIDSDKERSASGSATQESSPSDSVTSQESAQDTQSASSSLRDFEGVSSRADGQGSPVSAPPFYNPVHRSVHRNPAISIKSGTALDTPIANKPDPVDLESALDHQELPEALPLVIKRHSKDPFPSKRILTAETGEKDWTWSFDCPREPAIADFSQQLNPTITLDRDVLKDPRIIGTIDHEFILIQSGNQILAVDQHAADERVKLEQLQAKTTRDLQQKAFQQRLKAPLCITFSPHEQEVLRDYWRTISQWGWEGVMHWNSHVLELTHHPSILDTQFSSTDLKVYLHALDGAAGVLPYPPCVDRLLRSKACRSAVMFGDELPPLEQKRLLKDLSDTQLCFMCAHGRPTVVPVADLSLFSHSASP